MLRKLIIAAAVTGSCLTAAVPAFAFSDTFLDGMAGIAIYNGCYPGSVKADTFRFMSKMTDTMTGAEKATLKDKIEELVKIREDWCPAMKASGFSSVIEKFNGASSQ